MFLYAVATMFFDVFFSAFALGYVISKRKKKTKYNTNKLQVGLNYQGTKVSF